MAEERDREVSSERVARKRVTVRTQEGTKKLWDFQEGAERKQSHKVEEIHQRRIRRGSEAEQVALKGRRGESGASGEQREQRKCPGDKNLNLVCSQVD